MVNGIFILIGCQLIGEVLRQGLQLPVPGPVVGMFLLAGVLVMVDPKGARPPGPMTSSLAAAAAALIRDMGLLFVPAGVGIVAETDLIKTGWFPLLAALVISTVLSLLVTGLVMHWITAIIEARSNSAPARGTSRPQRRSL